MCTYLFFQVLIFLLNILHTFLSCLLCEYLKSIYKMLSQRIILNELKQCMYIALTGMEI